MAEQSPSTEQPMFVDTNVLVYAYDVSAGEKHQRAAALVEALWRSRSGRISVQVLQEFFVNATRKLPNPLDVTQARQIVTDLSYWKLHSPTARDVVAAAGLHERLSLSFWDAMIVQSAAAMGCRKLYSEDLNPGQDYEGVLVENPVSKG